MQTEAKMTTASINTDFAGAASPEIQELSLDAVIAKEEEISALVGEIYKRTEALADRVFGPIEDSAEGLGMLHMPEGALPLVLHRLEMLHVRIAGISAQLGRLEAL